MNIFVARLSANTKGDDLKELFNQFGKVDEAKVIMDRETGFSKRFGFVEMPEEEEGLEAIDKLNETEFDGSTIVVKKAQPKGDGGGGGRNYNR